MFDAMIYLYLTCLVFIMCLKFGICYLPLNSSGGSISLVSNLSHCLKSTDIDVILGMNWLTKYQAVIDCAVRSISITDLSGNTVLYWSSPATAPSARFVPEAELYAIDVLPPLEIHDVPVVCDFLDVFPEELPGMPPDRSVDFVIELVPGTAPVSRRPYRMPPEEVVELRSN
jgi:hypothetical protein